MSTQIYGLCDPCTPDVVMYVGKGLPQRAASHWKRFTRNGGAVNVLLRRWLESLQGVAPLHLIIEICPVENWEDRERFWVARWRGLNSNLCNVADGGNAWSIGASGLGGRRRQELHPDLSAQTGRRVHELHPELAVQAGRRRHELHPELNAQNGRRVHELHPELATQNGRKYGSIGGSIGGRRSHALHPELAVQRGRIRAHRRWHLALGVVNPKCALCYESFKAIARFSNASDILALYEAYFALPVAA